LTDFSCLSFDSDNGIFSGTFFELEWDSDFFEVELFEFTVEEEVTLFKEFLEDEYEEEDSLEIELLILALDDFFDEDFKLFELEEWIDEGFEEDDMEEEFLDFELFELDLDEVFDSVSLDELLYLLFITYNKNNKNINK